MSTETERKYSLRMSAEEIVKQYMGGRIPHLLEIEQRYLSGTGDWKIRLRKTDVDRAYQEFHLTLKRKICSETCIELETEITGEQYEEWSQYCDQRVLYKERVPIVWAGREWFIDIFTNPELKGVEFAEIEFEPGDDIELPPWVDRDITDDPQYRNFNLITRLPCAPS